MIFQDILINILVKIFIFVIIFIAMFLEAACLLILPPGISLDRMEILVFQCLLPLFFATFGTWAITCT